MEVAAGPTAGLKDHVGLPMFLHGEKEEKVEELVIVVGRVRNGFCLVDQEEDSSESSSIGAVSSSSSPEEDEDGGEDEVASKLKEGPLGSLDSLEESLPIKRGLSNFFTGKSKSFASLSDVVNAGAGDLAKPENPFNKRRRILKAYSNPSSWARRRASYSSLLPPLPPLTVLEGEDDEDDAAAAAAIGVDSPLPPLPQNHHEIKAKRAFRSPRSFSLSDLQHA